MLAEANIIYRLLAGKPIFAGFNVTNKCTMRCTFCSVPELTHRDMTLAEVEHALDCLNGVGVPVVGVTGGEPFMRKDLAAIVRAIASRGMKTTIVTNGELFDRSRAEELKEFGNIVHFALSVDSLDRGVYGDLRGKRKALEKILPRYLDSIAHGPKTAYKFNVVVGPDNLDELADFVRLAEACGLYVSFIPMNVAPGGLHRGRNYPSLTPEKRQQVASAFETLRRWKLDGRPLWDHRDFYLHAAAYMRGEAMDDCRAGRLFLDLRSDGKLAFCNEMEHFIDLLEVDRLTWSQVKGIRSAWRERIHACRTDSACCYTCSYNVTATAHNIPAYIWDYFRLKSVYRGR